MPSHKRYIWWDGRSYCYFGRKIMDLLAVTSLKNLELLKTQAQRAGGTLLIFQEPRRSRIRQSSYKKLLKAHGYPIYDWKEGSELAKGATFKNQKHKWAFSNSLIPETDPPISLGNAVATEQLRGLRNAFAAPPTPRATPRAGGNVIGTRRNGNLQVPVRETPPDLRWGAPPPLVIHPAVGSGPLSSETRTFFTPYTVVSLPMNFTGTVHSSQGVDSFQDGAYVRSTPSTGPSDGEPL